MNSLLIAPELFTTDSGITRMLRLYLRALCELAGKDGRVCFVALNDTCADIAKLGDCTGPALAERAVCHRVKARFVLETLRLSSGVKFILCGHVAQLPVAWLASWLRPGLHYALVAHGIEVWRPFGLLERLALRRATSIFCVSDYTRRQLLARCPLPADRAVVLPNALDPRFEISPGQPLALCPPVILVVTRLTQGDRYKGVDHLLEAMPAIRAALPDTTLRIIGRGDDAENLRRQCRDLGLDGAVEFLGFVDDRQLADELAACRLFALPSQKEGFGLVFLEAMARGRPCLGARAGGVPEVITPDCGILVDYGDVPALAAACITALNKTWDEAAILSRARHFSYSQFRERLGSLLPA